MTGLKSVFYVVAAQRRRRGPDIGAYHRFFLHEVGQSEGPFSCSSFLGREECQDLLLRSGHGFRMDEYIYYALSFINKTRDILKGIISAEEAEKLLDKQIPFDLDVSSAFGVKEEASKARRKAQRYANYQKILEARESKRIAKSILAERALFQAQSQEES